MIDLEHVRLRVRHFLLQQSKQYSRGVCQNPNEPISVSSVSQELAKKVDLSPRRLQKYLAKSLPPKELSIKLCDLKAIAHFGELQLGDFVAYLLQESRSSTPSKTQSKIQESLGSFHEGHRRALAATLFSGKDQKKSEDIIKIALTLYELGAEDLASVGKISEALSEKNKRERS